MKPLVILLLMFGSACLTTFISKGTVDHIFAGQLAMAVMLVFTSIGHFKFNKGMAIMLPPFIPFKKAVVYVTGVMEILFGVGLLFAQVRLPVAWTIIVFFIILLPANIYAAVRKVDLEKANYEGNGLNYLWFRVPLQVFFIGWVYYFAVVH
jgi:uncharacterized membrane protein